MKRAVSLLCLDIAIGVDRDYQTYTWSRLLTEGPSPEKDEDFHYLHTVNKLVPVPKVLLLQDFDKRPPQHIRFSRGQVFMRDQHTCQYCAKTLPKQKLNIDHVVPRTQGGKTTWENVVASCHYCNRKKGGRTPGQAGMKLLTIPHRPSVSPLLTTLKDLNPVWNNFILSPA